MGGKRTSRRNEEIGEIVQIHRLSPVQWSLLSEQAHLVCFKEISHCKDERIDYALVAEDENNVGTPAGYMTCRELDSRTVYWQFGGTFPGTKGTLKSLQAYKAAIDWHRGKYKTVFTLVENTNRPMLKFAAHVGFVIQGIRLFEGRILLEHVLNLDQPKGEI